MEKSWGEAEQSVDNRFVLWVPSHVGLEGNEIADKLHKKGTALHTKETPSQADTLKELSNHKIDTKYKQEADELATTKKWKDSHKIWAEDKDKPRKEVVAILDDSRQGMVA